MKIELSTKTKSETPKKFVLKVPEAVVIVLCIIAGAVLLLV